MYTCQGTAIDSPLCGGLSAEDCVANGYGICFVEDGVCTTNLQCTDLSIGECTGYSSGVILNGCTIEQSTNVSDSIQDVGVSVLKTFYEGLPYIVGILFSIMFVLWAAKWFFGLFGGRR